MTLPFLIYLTGWFCALCVAILIIYRFKTQFTFTQILYWRWLLVPWKLISFIAAFLVFFIVAPYSGDPTWDYVDATFMSVLTYFFAPWCVGTLYRFFKGGGTRLKAYVAVCLWLFSVSWSYDLYILLRDGYYPITWFPNMIASSVLFLCAGLMWSLEYRKNLGVTFGFTQNDWLSPGAAVANRKVLYFALPFVIIVGCIILYFLVNLIHY